MAQDKKPGRGKNPVYITDVMLRDAHQSLLATRLRTMHMLPIADKMNRAGYWSLEMWGGATIDSMMRFLNEDPWERVRVLKKAMPDTRLQMLMRGQNIVGYRNYADDVVREFVRLAAEAGIDVFRCFDALNDIRNLETSMAAVRENGKWVEGTISYTMSPVHNIPSFVAYADELVKRGAQSICIKDMAGLLEPGDAYELVSALKHAHPDVLVHMHSHYTSGMASMTYLKAVEAGADILDCAISSLSMGTSGPPTETMVAVLSKTDRATGMDVSLLKEISDYFRGIRKKYHQFESAFTAVDPDVLVWQIPGGMISNLSSQLEAQGALDRMDEVMAEVPRVRQELGYPPLVTPTSRSLVPRPPSTCSWAATRWSPKRPRTTCSATTAGPRDPSIRRCRSSASATRPPSPCAPPICWNRSCPSAATSWTSWASSTATKTWSPTPCSHRWRWSSSSGARAPSALARKSPP